MPDLGDYVTRLICDASKYQSGTKQAIDGNQALHGSVNSIIGQLNRQQQAMEHAGRTTLDWIAADQKASNEAKEHARALLERVNAAKAAKSATEELIAADRKRRAESMAPGSMTSRMTSWQQENDPFQQGLRRMKAAEDEITKEKIEAGKRRLAAGKELDEQAARDEQINADIRARQAKNRADREAYEAEGLAGRRERQLRKDDANVMAQLEAQGYFNRRGKRPDDAPAKAGKAWAGAEAFRGIEDFVQGSAYGGLRGGIVAASNNLSQMGAAFGPYGAMAGSAAATVSILGVTAAEAWKKSRDGSEQALASVREYDRMVGSVLSRTKEMQSLRFSLQDTRGLPSSDASRQREEELRRDIQVAELDARSRATALADKKKAMGMPANAGVADLDREFILRQDDWRPWLDRRRPGQMRQNRIAGRVPDAMLTQDARDKWREEERMAAHEANVLVAKRTELSAAQARTKEMFDREAEIGNHRAHQAEAEHRAQEEERMGRARNYVAQENLRASVADPFIGLGKGGRALGIEADFRERQLKIREAFSQGAFGDGPEAEAKRREALGLADRDRMRQHRELKYGDLPASDGSTGFGARANTAEGWTQIMKSIRATNENQQIAELKRNGDATEQVRTAVERLGDIMKDTAAQVVEF